MYALYDTFNNKILSRHRTIAAAVNASHKLQDAISRKSPGGYLPTAIKRIVNGELVELTDSERDEMDHE